MAALQSAHRVDLTNHFRGPSKPTNVQQKNLPGGAQSLSVTVGRTRSSILNLDMLSPVNQNGSFEFDRVLKSGIVQKRTRKTKAWKPIFLVLRPNSLSIYKNEREDKLRHKIHLSDLTAVTFLKDPKNKRQNIFGLFSPSRNYHLEAPSTADANEWVDLIRKESRVEEEEDELFLFSPNGNPFISSSLDKTSRRQTDDRRLREDRLGSSSPEPGDPVIPTRNSESIDMINPRKPSYTIEYSGNEIASQSDWSDTDLSKTKFPPGSIGHDENIAIKPPLSNSLCGSRNLSQMSGFDIEQGLERVVWQGYLLWLRSKGGVRQWKNMWVVIRCKSITCYKDDSEYLPSLIIPFSSVINAVEIDPISKTKKLCLQIITEEKSYRFCARSEDTLDKSLGAIKSLIAQRRETRIIR